MRAANATHPYILYYDSNGRLVYKTRVLIRGDEPFSKTAWSWNKTTVSELPLMETPPNPNTVFHCVRLTYLAS